MKKQNKYTPGYEDAERFFEALEKEVRKAKQQEWYRKMKEQKRKGGGERDEDTSRPTD